MNLSSRLFLALSVAPLLVAQTQFSTYVLALSPLGFWPLNGNANDATTHSNNGTLMNAVTFTSLFPPPVEAQAAVFDRSQSQFISLSAQGSVGFNLGSLHPYYCHGLDQNPGAPPYGDREQGRPVRRMDLRHRQ